MVGLRTFEMFDQLRIWSAQASAMASPTRRWVTEGDAGGNGPNYTRSELHLPVETVVKVISHNPFVNIVESDQ
jgi:hypothetical protein